MPTIHIPESEVAKNFAAVLAHLRSGTGVAVEENCETVALVTRPTKRPGRMLSEIRRKKRISQEMLADELELERTEVCELVVEVFSAEVEWALDAVELLAALTDDSAEVEAETEETP